MMHSGMRSTTISVSLSSMKTHLMREVDDRWVRWCGIRAYSPVVYHYSGATCSGCRSAFEQYWVRMRNRNFNVATPTEAFMGVIH